MKPAEKPLIECPRCFGCGHMCDVCGYPINACYCNLDLEHISTCKRCGGNGTVKSGSRMPRSKVVACA